MRAIATITHPFPRISYRQHVKRSADRYGRAIFVENGPLAIMVKHPDVIVIVGATLTLRIEIRRCEYDSARPVVCRSVIDDSVVSYSISGRGCLQDCAADDRRIEQQIKGGSGGRATQPLRLDRLRLHPAGHDRGWATPVQALHARAD
jgi:hypothetical protein